MVSSKGRAGLALGKLGLFIRKRKGDRTDRPLRFAIGSKIQPPTADTIRARLYPVGAGVDIAHPLELRLGRSGAA